LRNALQSLSGQQVRSPTQFKAAIRECKRSRVDQQAKVTQQNILVQKPAKTHPGRPRHAKARFCKKIIFIQQRRFACLVDVRHTAVHNSADHLSARDVIL
jgi:hypothetical protein